MLQKLRDKSSGWFATIILGLLTVPFAFFGMEQYLFQNNATYAAKIEAPPKWWASAPSWWPAIMLWQRDTISPEDFRTQFEQQRQAQRRQQGDAFDARAFESTDNKRQILDSMIDQRVLGMAAARQGIVVSDAQVRNEIESYGVFQVDGKFNGQIYQQTLASLNPPRTPLQFQQEIRDDLQRRMLPMQLVQSAFVTPSQVDAVMKLLDEKRDVAYVTLPAPVPDQSPVSSDEIARWYDAHKAQYRAPETVTLEYVDVDTSKVPAPAPPSEDALRKLYDTQKDTLGTPEQRQVSHILVKLDPGADAAAQKAALDKAQALAAQARAPGADFAALARANSDDLGSKNAGGDLGWITHNGAMVKPFEDAVFAMKAGEISAPVKSQFGYHIIDVREIKPSQQPPFEAVRDKLVAQLSKNDNDHAFNDLLGKMVDEVNKNPTTLSGAARVANVTVQRLGPIARVAPGAMPADANDIATNAAVQRQAFSDAMIADGTPGDPIEITPGRDVLIRVTAHTPERSLTLAQATPRVTAEIRAERARKAAVARADQMLAKVKAGESLQTLAGEAKLPMANIPAMPRNVPVLPPDATEQVFAVPTPVAGKVSVGKVAMPDGSVVVFAVSKVIDGNPTNATPAQRMQLQQQLAQIAGGLDADALVKTLRKQAKIQVAEDRL